MTKKQKKRIVIFVIIVLAVLLVPIPTAFVSDGGTVEYSAILYKVIVYHSLDENYESGYYEAIEFRFFPFNYFDS